MLTYLIFAIVLLTIYVSYKYILFKKSHICSTKSSIGKFFKFWLKKKPRDTHWEHFVHGKGTFQLSDNLINEKQIYGGGISGSW